MEGLQPIAEVPPLTCWDTWYSRWPGSTEPALRYVVEEGQKPAAPGTGIHAYNPSEAGEAYYAVIQIDRSLPAFTRCSLDDDLGSGDPEKGPPAGQLNRYLNWETEGIADEPGRWEMTVALTGGAPKDSCEADVTPRRCQKFKVKPGDKFRWTNTTIGGNKKIQSGEVVADSHGLVTLEKVTIAKGKNRLAIFR